MQHLRSGPWRTVIFLFPVLAIALLAAAPVPAQNRIEHDRWYAVLMDNRHVGWSHALLKLENGRWITINQTSVTIQRGPLTMPLSMASRFVETVEGQPIEAESTQQLAAMEVRQSMRFGPTTMELINRQGATEHRQELPLPQRPWLPPAAAGRYVEQELARQNKQIRVTTLEPALGPNLIDVVTTVEGPADVEVLGKVVPALRWHVEISALPGLVLEEFVDAQGRTLRSTMKVMPGIELLLVEADQSIATAPVDPPELMAQTLIAVATPIAQPRQLRSAIYELTYDPPSAASTQPDAPIVLNPPRAGSQRVIWGEGGRVRVVVDLDEPVNPVHDLPSPEHRQASVILNFEDPTVRNLVAMALSADGRELPDADKAERLRRFVRSYVKTKSLAVGFATASEVARTRQGDCSEHAVLLAALLRGAGIPSRTVSGLIYTDEFLGRKNIFAYHMWTQAWLTQGVGGRWVDLDATLDALPFDAAHIALATSSQSDAGAVNDIVKIAGLLGRLSLQVVWVEAADPSPANTPATSPSARVLLSPAHP